MALIRNPLLAGKTRQMSLGTKSLNRLLQVQKQNEKNLATLQSVGVDTSKVTDDKQNPLFSALEELDQIIGTQGSIEFFSRLAETKTKGGKKWQPGEQKELIAGGVVPWALIAAGSVLGTILGGVGGAAAGGVGAVPGAAAGGAGGAKLAALILGGLGLGAAGVSYARGQAGMNKYLDYRGSEEKNLRQFIGVSGEKPESGRQAMSTALLKFLDQESGTKLAKSPAANIVTGLVGGVLMDNLRLSFGTKEVTKQAITSELLKGAMRDVGMFPDTFKMAGITMERLARILPDDVMAYLKLIWDDDTIKTFGKPAQEVMDMLEARGLKPGVHLGELTSVGKDGQRIANEVRLAIRQGIMQKVGDLGGIKMISRHAPSMGGIYPQKMYDQIHEAIKWNILADNPIRHLARGAGAKRMAKREGKTLEQMTEAFEQTGKVYKGELDQWIRKVFGLGRLGEAYAKSGSSFEDDVLKALSHRVSSDLTRAANLGVDEFKKFTELLDNPVHRNLAGMLIGLQYGANDDREFLELLDKIRQASGMKLKISENAGKLAQDVNAEGVHVRAAVHGTGEAAEEAQRLASLEVEVYEDRLQGLLEEIDDMKARLLEKHGYKEIQSILEEAGLAREDIEKIIEAMEIFRERMADDLLLEITAGFNNRDLMGSTRLVGHRSRNYAPGYLPDTRTRGEQSAFEEAYNMLKAVNDSPSDNHLGLTANLEDIKKGRKYKGGKPQYMYSQKEAEESKKLLTIIDRFNAGFETETDIAKLAAMRRMKAYNRKAMMEFKQAILLSMGRPIFRESVSVGSRAVIRDQLSGEEVKNVDVMHEAILSAINSITRNKDRREAARDLDYIIRVISKANDVQDGKKIQFIRQLLIQEIMKSDDPVHISNMEEIMYILALMDLKSLPKSASESSILNKIISMARNIEENVADYRGRTGVYLIKDEAGNVIYVGKSKNLLNRLRTYLKKGMRGGFKTGDDAREMAQDMFIYSLSEIRDKMLRQITDDIEGLELGRYPELWDQYLEVNDRLWRMSRSILESESQDFVDRVNKELRWDKLILPRVSVKTHTVVDKWGKVAAKSRTYSTQGYESWANVVNRMVNDPKPIPKQQASELMTHLKNLNVGIGDISKKDEAIQYVLGILGLAGTATQKRNVARALLSVIRKNQDMVGRARSTWQYELIESILLTTSAGAGRNLENVPPNVVDMLFEALTDARTALDDDEAFTLLIWNVAKNTTIKENFNELAETLGRNITEHAPFDVSHKVNRYIREGVPRLRFEDYPDNYGLVAVADGGKWEDPVTGQILGNEWRVEKRGDGTYIVRLVGTVQEEGLDKTGRPLTNIEEAWQHEASAGGSFKTAREAKEFAQEMHESLKYSDYMGLYDADAPLTQYAETGRVFLDKYYTPRMNAFRDADDRLKRVVLGRRAGDSKDITVGDVLDDVRRLTREIDVPDNMPSYGRYRIKGRSLLEEFRSQLTGIEYTGDAEEAIRRIEQRLYFYDEITRRITSDPDGWDTMDDFADEIVDVIKYLGDAQTMKAAGIDSFKPTWDMIVDMGTWVPARHKNIPWSRTSLADASRIATVRAGAVRSIPLLEVEQKMAGYTRDLISHATQWSEGNEYKTRAVSLYFNFLWDKNLQGRVEDGVVDSAFTQEFRDMFAQYMIEELGYSKRTAKQTMGYVNQFRNSILKQQLGAKKVKQLRVNNSLIDALWDRKNGRLMAESGNVSFGPGDLRPLQKKANYHITDEKITELTDEAWDEYERYRDYLTVKILYDSGMRENEFQELDWDDMLNLAVYGTTGKGGKYNNYQLTGETIAEARKFAEKYADLAKEGGPLTDPFMYKDSKGKLHRIIVFGEGRTNKLNQSLQKRAAEMGTYQNITTHALRRSSTTHGYYSGEDVLSLQKRLNHDNLETTFQYIQEQLAPIFDDTRGTYQETFGHELYYRLKDKMTDLPETVSDDEYLRRLANATIREKTPEYIFDASMVDKAVIHPDIMKSVLEARHSPGVIIFKNADGEEILVQRASDIAQRAGSIVNNGTRNDMIRKMLSEADSIEVVYTTSEAKALAEETRLIKELNPKYNYGTEFSWYKTARPEYDTPVEEIGKDIPIRTRAEQDAYDEYHEFEDFTDSPVDMSDKPLRSTASSLNKAMAKLNDDETVVSVIQGGERVYYAINKDIADFFVKFMQERFTDDEAMKQFFRFYDAGLTLWKRQATILRLGFHARNKLSNAFLMWIHGMFNPYYWAMGPKILRASDSDFIDFQGNEALMRMFGTTNLSHRQIVELASDNRVRVGYMESAQIRGMKLGKADVRGESLLKTAGMGEGWNPFAEASKISKGMQYIGTEWVEDADRTALFVTALARGFTPEEAGRLVDRILYDYSPMGLSLIESSVLKRIMPFYTWMKRNTPEMLRMITTNPLLFQNLKRLSEGTFDAYELDRSIMPDYLAQAAPVFAMPFTDERGNRLVMNMGIPLADVNRILEPRELLSSFAPPFKMLMEYPQNYDLYYGKPIAPTPGAKKRMPTMIYPIDWAMSNKLTGKTWDQFLKTLGIVETEDKYSGKKYLAGDAYSIKMMKDLMPILNTVSKMGVDPLENTGQSLSELMGEMMGVKAIPYDVESLTRYEDYRKFGELQAMIGKAKAQQLIPETSTNKKIPFRTMEEVLKYGSKPRSSVPTSTR